MCLHLHCEQNTQVIQGVSNKVVFPIGGPAHAEASLTSGRGRQAGWSNELDYSNWTLELLVVLVPESGQGIGHQSAGG